MSNEKGDDDDTEGSGDGRAGDVFYPLQATEMALYEVDMLFRHRIS